MTKGVVEKKETQVAAKRTVEGQAGEGKEWCGGETCRPASVVAVFERGGERAGGWDGEGGGRQEWVP